MTKKPQETKAELRRQLHAAQAAIEQAKIERDAARSHIALLDRRVDAMRHEREYETRMVRRIVDLINLHQPSSALLPANLRTMKPDRFDPRHTRMTPPADYTFAFTNEPTKPFEPLNPIILNDLVIFIERHPAEWSRLVAIEYRPSRPGIEASRLQIKLSEETTCALLGARERFCEEIGRQAAVSLYAHLIERQR